MRELCNTTCILKCCLFLSGHHVRNNYAMLFVVSSHAQESKLLCAGIAVFFPSFRDSSFVPIQFAYRTDQKLRRDAFSLAGDQSSNHIIADPMPRSQVLRMPIRLISSLRCSIRIRLPILMQRNLIMIGRTHIRRLHTLIIPRLLNLQPSTSPTLFHSISHSLRLSLQQTSLVGFMMRITLSRTAANAE